ncbi:MAG: alpha/beta hydrolase [Kouleothrix sp.]|nr:alpha/beta hydrolase [Kouleothrix sp.]
MLSQHGRVRIEQRRIRVAHANIAYQVAGDGPPLVLIHGLSGSSRWWERNIPALAQRYRVHVVDLIGFGASRARHSFVLKDAAAYLAAWMDQLGLHQAHMVGHSMGAVIAADLAADFPDRVDRLVLVDAAMFVAEQDPLAHALGVIQEFGLHQPHFLPILLGDAFQAGLFTLTKAAAELLTTDITPKLQHISVPTLVIWGQHDTITPPEAGWRLCRALPNGRMIIVRGAGHNPMWERPSAFNEAILNFFEQPATSAETAYDSGAPEPAGMRFLEGAQGSA